MNASYKPKHRRQSAGCHTAENTQNTRSYGADSSLKHLTATRDEETSAGGQGSSTPPETGLKRFERKVDRLEDLVWRLYDELDNKIQDLFEEHTNKFKQQNDIITNIFHGFGTEITNIKEEMQMQRLKENTYSNPNFYTEEARYSEGESPRKDSVDEEQSSKIFYNLAFYPYLAHLLIYKNSAPVHVDEQR